MNLIKFIVEFVGTMVITLAYFLLGDQESGLLFAYWIVTLFAFQISGSHFNPSITIASMIRNQSTFGKRRILGVMYIACQFLGALAGVTLANFVLNKKLYVHPNLDDNDDSKNIGTVVSEFIGSFFFVFMYMHSTDDKTKFSEDKVINCFIIAASYIGARLVGGGYLMTEL